MHFTIVGASSSASFVCKPREKYHTIMHYGGEETPLHYAQSHIDRQAGQRRRRAAAKNHLCKQPSSITSCPRERDAACLPARLPGQAWQAAPSQDRNQMARSLLDDFEFHFYFFMFGNVMHFWHQKTSEERGRRQGKMADPVPRQPSV